MTSLDTFLMALAVWREARGETSLGQACVAAVIHNRAHDAKHRWPRHVVDVVTQRWQFSAFNKDDPNALLFPKAREAAQWEHAMRAYDERALFTEVADALARMNHYHTTAIAPKWAEGHRPLLTVGHHHFYAL